MNAYKLTLFMHVGLGVAALVSYWVAALAKKGSASAQAGRQGLRAAMVGLLLPAMPLAMRVFGKSSTFGWFLFYLLLITATALWQGWFAVRRKRDFAAYTGPGFRALAWLNIAGGRGRARPGRWPVPSRSSSASRWSACSAGAACCAWRRTARRIRAGGWANTSARCSAAASPRTSPSC